MRKVIKGCLLLTFGIVFFVIGTESYAAEKSITINRFQLLIYSDKKEEAIPIKNASVKILYYDADGKRQVVQEGINSDENGEIKEATVNMPEEIKRIYFQLGLTNTDAGSLVNSKGIVYNPTVSIPIPEDRQIDHTETRFIMNSGDESTKERNYQSVKVWNLYQTMVKEMRDSVQTTLDTFPELKETFNYTFEPIPVLYEHNYKIGNGAFFKSKAIETIGVIKKGTPYIHIPHLESLNSKTREQQEEAFNVNLSHEWQHWTMFKALGSLAGGDYSSHSGYNSDVKMSYKEGWALFHANRYPYGYNWSWRLDNSIQTLETVDTTGKLEKCYGKSSNWTVNSVLRDIYDMESPREPEDQYDIAKDWKPDVGTGDLEYRKKLANGLMFIAMVNSKATTMEEYVSYLREQGFVKDKIRFDILLTLNGLDYKGRFTLDEEGNRITY
ncbi:hypothetical protein [Enterococcus sp. AZ007]|uniref:hypothetical protein n=1 Tax=Enterococcus sp. AZ007 TaxID=2774839 RepID=UPI003F223728